MASLCSIWKKNANCFFEVLFFKMTLALSLFFILWNSIILFKMWITFLEEKISKGAHLGVAGVHLQLRFFCPTPSWKKYPSQKLICIPHHLPNVGCFFLPLPPPGSIKLFSPNGRPWKYSTFNSELNIPISPYFSKRLVDYPQCR